LTNVYTYDYSNDYLDVYSTGDYLSEYTVIDVATIISDEQAVYFSHILTRV